MKCRIIYTKELKFEIQYKYLLSPFWCTWLTGYNSRKSAEKDMNKLLCGSERIYQKS